MNPLTILNDIYVWMKGTRMPATLDQDIVNALQKAEDDQQTAIQSDQDFNTSSTTLTQAQTAADHAHQVQLAAHQQATQSGQDLVALIKQKFGLPS
jgi:hypothetical protein